MGFRPERLFAARAHRLQPSEIRQILRLTLRPDVVSFAGGLPDPASFPLELIRTLSAQVLDQHGPEALQYGLTMGVPELREAIAQLMRREGVQTDPEQVIVTSGSQQGLSLTATLLLEPKDHVIVGSPTYLGLKLLATFHEAIADPVPVDDEGMDPQAVEDLLRRRAQEGTPVKFVYAMPTFQNPSGVTISSSRRRALVDVVAAYDTLLVEDDPYSRLRFAGDHQRPLIGYDDEGHVLYLSTFSKLLAPGFRIGWAQGHPSILEKFNLTKQSRDLHTNSFGQYLTAAYLREGHLDRHVATICALYKRKCEAMLLAIDHHFPPEVTVTRPQGGLFTWAVCPPQVDTGVLLPRAIEQKVAFVTGRSFYTDPGAGANAMRLNFSHPPLERIGPGIERLGGVLRTAMVAR